MLRRQAASAASPEDNEQAVRQWLVNKQRAKKVSWRLKTVELRGLLAQWLLLARQEEEIAMKQRIKEENRRLQALRASIK